VGAVRIFEKPEYWDTTAGLINAVTTRGIVTIYLPSGPLSLDGAQWYLLKHTLTMMMIAFITIKSSLVPLIEGLCAQI